MLSISAEMNRAESKSAPITGAEIVVRSLQEEGVEHVFGYPGGAVLYIYDEIFKQDKFQHILVRHEQAAVHAADAYSRSSHRIGVALVTSGPGVTNAVTGIATAYMDSIPMVIITGQVPTPAIGTAFSAVSSALNRSSDVLSLAIQKVYAPLTGGTTKVRSRCPYQLIPVWASVSRLG